MSGGASGQPPDNGAKSTCFRRGKAGVCVGEEANQTAAGSGSVEEDYPGGGGSDALYQGFFGKGLDPPLPHAFSAGWGRRRAVTSFGENEFVGEEMRGGR